MSMRTKVLIELYFRKITGYILILGIIFLISLLFSKEKETLFLMLVYIGTRMSFGKQFHCSSTIKCIIATIIVFAIAIVFTFNFHLSLLQCLVVGAGINYILHLVAISLTKETTKVFKNRREKILNIVPNDENEIELYCKERGLLNISETIYLYLNNTTEEVAEILEINESTVTRRINKFLKTTSKE